MEFSKLQIVEKNLIQAMHLFVIVTCIPPGEIIICYHIIYLS